MTGRGLRDWWFRNRQTGEITIGQPPNAPLIITMIAFGSRRLFRPPGTIGNALTVIGTGALAFWAGDELLRGVNPWRRMTGAVVLSGVVTAVVRARR